MDGIILLNKEKDISSFKAINNLKYKLKLKKVGHAGTLDPLAEGLMIVLVNNATKLSDMMLKQDKEYYVECDLGYETDTYDSTGEKTHVFDEDIKINLKRVEEVLEKFIGAYDQIPPMYSAIKINGKKLYDLARKGIEVERKHKVVDIEYIKNIELDDNKVKFLIKVSSGTYIRSIIQDFGRHLGTYATMTKLVRTKIGKYNVEDSNTIKNINDEKSIISTENIFEFPKLILDDNEYFKIKNGIKLKKDMDDSYYKIYHKMEYVGLGIIENSVLRRLRYFH